MSAASILSLCLVLTGCSPRALILDGVADELASQGQAPEEDLILAHEASAFYLKLSESLLRKSPGNLKLAESVAAGFTQYAYTFVAFEADRVEASDSKAAHRLRDRAARLYLRAHRHAMTALNADQPGFSASLSDPSPARWPRLRQDQVGVAYWAAAAWGAYVSLSTDDARALADLPTHIRLATLAWKRSPDFGEGALSSLMGSFETVRAGGTTQQASAYFDRALSAGGSNAGVFVARAESIALPAGDRSEFEKLLNQAVAIGTTHPDLRNQAMALRAQWLLERVEDLF